MKIALLTEVFLPKIDGITNRLRHALRCLEEEGHECLLLAPDTALAEHGATRIVRIPSLPFPRYPGVRIALPDLRIAASLAAFRPDVVHAVGPAALGVMGIAAARALGLPIVASYHTDFPRYLPGYGLGFAERAIWPLIRAVHGEAHVDLCPSQFTREELGITACAGSGSGAAASTPSCSTPAALPRDALRLSGGRPEGPLLLYVGRSRRRKASPASPRSSISCPALGSPSSETGPPAESSKRPSRPTWRKAACTSPLPRGEELAEAFASADVFVMPSKTETLGFVVLEAMASGLPVVAAHAGGLPDLVSPEENGLLHHPDRPREAAEAIRRILGDEGRRRLFARLARKSAEGASWSAETRRLEGAYQRAIVLARQARGPLRRLGGQLFA